MRWNEENSGGMRVVAHTPEPRAELGRGVSSTARISTVRLEPGTERRHPVEGGALGRCRPCRPTTSTVTASSRSPGDREDELFAAHAPARHSAPRRAAVGARRSMPSWCSHRRRPRGRHEHAAAEVADVVVHVLQRRGVVVHGVRRRVVGDRVGEHATVAVTSTPCSSSAGGDRRCGELRRLRRPVLVQALGDRSAAISSRGRLPPLAWSW